MKKLNLNGLFEEEVEYVEKHFDFKGAAKQQTPNKMETGEVLASQSFDIISQLVGDIPTQKSAIQSPNFNTEKRIITQKSRSNDSREQMTSQTFDQFKKRTIDEIRSPSMNDMRNNNNEPKKAKICSQTVRNLNRFAFTEKAETNSSTGEEINEIDDQDKSIFAIPIMTQNLQSTQIVDNSQSISKSQKTKSNMQYSQKTLLSINDDDFNVDF